MAVLERWGLALIVVAIVAALVPPMIRGAERVREAALAPESTTSLAVTSAATAASESDVERFVSDAAAMSPVVGLDPTAPSASNTLPTLAPGSTSSTVANGGYTLLWSTELNNLTGGQPFTSGIVVPYDEFYVFLSPQDASSVHWVSDGGVRVYDDDGYPWREWPRVSILGGGEHVLSATINGAYNLEVHYSMGAVTSTTVGGGATTSTTGVRSTTTTRVRSTTSTTVVSTTVPGDGVFVGVGESIQAVVDAHGAGTTFVIGAGTHHRQSVVPKEGDVFVGESGAVLSGDGVSEFAFRGSGAGSVTIRGLTIEEYATPTQKGVIENAGGSYGWVVDGNVIRYNGGTGIRADTGWRVVNNVIDHNGQLGLYASGSGILVSGNEISFNNTQGVDSHWEAGGTKFGHTTNLVVRGNYVHDNDGPGLWTDGANVNTLYEQNRVIDNRGPGIDHEVSGAAVIRNNVVEGNGFAWTGWVDGAGILVNSSPDVEVYGNTVRYNNDGIAGIYADRSDGGPLKNLWVHDNVIAMNTGQTGVVTNAGNVVFSPEWNNRFDYNTYTLGSGSAYYRWADGEITVEQWKATGQDAHSTWN